MIIIDEYNSKKWSNIKSLVNEYLDNKNFKFFKSSYTSSNELVRQVPMDSDFAVFKVEDLKELDVQNFKDILSLLFIDEESNGGPGSLLDITSSTGDGQSYASILNVHLDDYLELCIYHP